MLYGEILHQHLKLINEHVVADTIDYLEMKFTFQTDDWDGLEKWAHFAKNGAVYDIRLTDDCIRKEDHLNLSAGVWKVYLHGNEFADGKVIERITTCVENLRVYPTGSLNGEPFPDMPASVTEQILARLDDIEQNGGTGGLTPVDKTDAMTAEVGRDEDGRLWTAGTGRGVKTLSIGRTEQGIEFGATLENGTKLAAFAPMSDVRIEKTAPTAETPGAEGELLFDESAGVLYVGGGAFIPAFSDKTEYLWTAVGGGSGLPEHTAADEGKFLRIVGGSPAWVALINGEEVKF